MKEQIRAKEFLREAKLQVRVWKLPRSWMSESEDHSEFEVYHKLMWRPWS